MRNTPTDFLKIIKISSNFDKILETFSNHFLEVTLPWELVLSWQHLSQGKIFGSSLQFMNEFINFFFNEENFLFFPSLHPHPPLLRNRKNTKEIHTTGVNNATQQYSSVCTPWALSEWCRAQSSKDEKMLFHACRLVCKMFSSSLI